MNVTPVWKAAPKPAKRWRKRLSPVSPKRKATNVIRRANVEARWGQHPPCFACLPLMLVGIDRTATGCNGLASDAHEVLSRARSGQEENLTDTDGIRPVSRQCHAFIDAHDDVAQAAGLSLPSVPVRQPTLVQDPWTGRMTAPRSIP